MIDQTITLPEIEKKGKYLYESRLKNKLEPKKNGKYLVIEVESGKYFINESLDEALKEAKTKFPNKIFYTVRVGYPGVFSFSRIRLHDSNTLWPY